MRQTSMAIRAVASFYMDRGSRPIVARGVNRGLNYTTRWRPQTQVIRQKKRQSSREATMDKGSRPPETGAQVRILPGAPRLTWEYDFLSAT